MKPKVFSDEELKVFENWKECAVYLNMPTDLQRFLATIDQRDKRIEELEAEVQSYDDLIVLQNTRFGVAADYWRKMNNQRKNFMPDLGNLLDFLMKMITLHEITEEKHLQQLADLKAENEKLNNRIDQTVNALQSFYDAYTEGEIELILEGDKFDLHGWLKDIKEITKG